MNTLKQKQNLQSGFSLIELLVVIAIVGLLSSIVLVTVATARRSARDVTIKSMMRLFSSALDVYIEEVGDYPTVAFEDHFTHPGWDYCPAGGNCGFVDSLVNQGILLDQVKVPPGSNEFWYFHRIKTAGKTISATLVNTCYMGAICGFTQPGMDFSGCAGLSGLPPADTTAKAVVLFWLEGGVSPDYVSGGPLGGNAICYY